MLYRLMERMIHLNQSYKICAGKNNEYVLGYCSAMMLPFMKRLYKDATFVPMEVSLILKQEKPMTKLFRVTTGVRGERVLGYCVAETIDDVRAFYGGQTVGELQIQAIEPVIIQPNFAARREALLLQIAELNQKLKELK